MLNDPWSFKLFIKDNNDLAINIELDTFLSHLFLCIYYTDTDNWGLKVPQPILSLTRFESTEESVMLSVAESWLDNN